jgi:quercetin dioxygenase-like cupin family protein
MGFINLEELAEREMVKGAKAKFIHMNGMTVSHWSFEQGTQLPEHSHHHEQITKLVSGQFELTVDGESKILTHSDIAVIPSHTVHSGRAITDCVMMDVFTPVREDYR